MSHRTIVALGALLCGLASQLLLAQAPKCSLKHTTYNGWEALELSNGVVALVITPEIGGRAIQLKLGAHAFFFVNAELAGKIVPREQNDRGHAWANYGGDKDWLAPQGFDTADEWAGPPDYALDGSRYTAEVVTDSPQEVAVRVTSPPDERSGLTLSRTYHLERGSARVRVEHRMRNTSLREVRWGFQEVTQSDTADPGKRQAPNPDLWVYCPVNPRSRYPRGYIPQYGDVTHPAYHLLPEGLFGLHYVYEVAQVGLDSDAGWLAVWNGKGGHTFVERFRYVPGGDYPDRCTVEFYLNGPARQAPASTKAPAPADPRVTPYYLETEIISPYIRLWPGEEGAFETAWFATRLPGRPRGVTDAGVVSEPFEAHVTGSSVRLAGAFGVFYRGRAEISFKSREGEELLALPLGEVEPEQPLQVDRHVDLPKGTWRISLVLKDTEGRERGELGNVVLDQE